LKLFENDLNADLKTGNLKVHVAMVPMPRDQLYAALASGKVDMVAAMPPIVTVDDLAGQEVFVRKASVYYETPDQAWVSTT
jgi:membrane-bound lytic murein transglycosylase MltF